MRGTTHTPSDVELTACAVDVAVDAIQTLMNAHEYTEGDQRIAKQIYDLALSLFDALPDGSEFKQDLESCLNSLEKRIP